MARMIPRQPSGPHSERIVFKALEAQLPDDWIVIHSKRFTIPRPHRSPIEGEVDFLVLDPSRGYVGFEVKGGTEIGRDEDGWYSVPHGKSVRVRIKDPGQQAQDAVHQINKYLTTHQKLDRSRTPPSFGYGVIFPDFEIQGRLDPGLPRDIVIDSKDLANARKSIDALFRKMGVVGPPLDPLVQQSFLNTLAPCLRLVKPLVSKIESDEAALLRLTEEQAHIVEVLAEQPRVLVEGPAGTGKTVLGMQRARTLADEGQRVLFLCYNRALAGHLGRCADGFEVHSYHSLCAELAKYAGLRWQPDQGGEPLRFWEETAPEILDNALDALPDQRWDAIVVDEGQDFAELWWAGIEKLLEKPDTGSIWIFLDPNQNIYGGGPSAALTMTKAKLTFNCRNTRHIAEFSSRARGIDVKIKDEAPEGTQVTEVVCKNAREMCDETRKALHGLIQDEKLNLDQVKILSPKAPARSDVFAQNRFGNVTLKEFPGVLGPNQIGFATLQRFKGLESDAVILCEVEDDAPTCTPSHLYVGMTRAKHHLTIIRYR